ncbi:transcriptional regulator with AbiEi antitoxin domain of type IV toxin-antitoxin system [Rhizobium sp. ERR 1071]|uniref:type IV toxin-antitoxin system AbiEi family antitoxin domain-containing protein n=1 Tax=Rhizobium sp. ERR 1071 TaxID=2572677 RepID=UPI00119BE978|nr:type IV toxin-antitoxin system AbiEi family antitoxin domain-containing protein [Rhizobium sp. ERR1071]TWB08765.1 transcriptional regulator with AbiEi antitoxin domain of type IV toxin-antitoxin system [Rhizobium sp. ERR1071]
MSRQTGTKLKQLLQTVPPGFLVDTGWMSRHAISRQSVSGYVKQGWLEPVLKGLYRRPFTPDTNPEAVAGWKIPLLSAVWLIKHRFHVGGSSALTLRGHIHYLSLGGEFALYLYGSDIPPWLSKMRIDARVVLRTGNLFGDETVGVENSDFSLADDDDAELALSPWRWPVPMSSPERAILEMIAELPKDESFHNVDMAFESLANLRPKLLMTLLGHCRSVKTKRLFFIYADKHNHGWRKHIDVSAVDLGKGDRALTPGGRLHPVYRVTIPNDLMPKETSHGA